MRLLPFHLRFVCRSLFLIAMLGVVACDSTVDDDSAPPEAVDVLYNRARDEMDQRNYKSAVAAYEEVERQHPYSEWAKHALIMSAYTNYRATKFDDAILTLERYVKLYPNSDSTDYAYYLTALCKYEQITDVGRDQRATQEALDALTEVVNRFPNSEYARDAKLKRDLAFDHLAGKEMVIGRYYLNRGEPLAGINRFKYVLDNFGTTSHVPEALHRLVESYLLLGVKEEAKRYAAVLGHNFPGSRWYENSYELLNGEGKKPEEAAEGNAE